MGDWETMTWKRGPKPIVMSFVRVKRSGELYADFKNMSETLAKYERKYFALKIEQNLFHRVFLDF